MEIRFNLEGFDAYEQALIRLIAMLRDLRPFWPRLAPIFVGWMRERFATQGEFGGDAWAPLNPAYLARKMTMYPGKGILYASGDLRQAASRPRRLATPTSITFEVDDSAYTHGSGTNRSVVEYHQQGSSTMPARPVIPATWNTALPFELQKEVEEEAELWINEMAAKLGLR